MNSEKKENTSNINNIQNTKIGQIWRLKKTGRHFMIMGEPFYITEDGSYNLECMFLCSDDHNLYVTGWPGNDYVKLEEDPLAYYLKNDHYLEPEISGKKALKLLEMGVKMTKESSDFDDQFKKDMCDLVQKHGADKVFKYLRSSVSNACENSDAKKCPNLAGPVSYIEKLGRLLDDSIEVLGG